MLPTRVPSQRLADLSNDEVADLFVAATKIGKTLETKLGATSCTFCVQVRIFRLSLLSFTHALFSGRQRRWSDSSRAYMRKHTCCLLSMSWFAAWARSPYVNEAPASIFSLPLLYSTYTSTFYREGQEISSATMIYTILLVTLRLTTSYLFSWFCFDDD